MRKYVGDSQPWVRTPWLAREETSGPYDSISVQYNKATESCRDFLQLTIIASNVVEHQVPARVRRHRQVVVCLD